MKKIERVERNEKAAGTLRELSVREMETIAGGGIIDFLRELGERMRKNHERNMTRRGGPFT